MKIVIDIDGTLCDEDSADMSLRIPYPSRIKKLNTLYDSGTEIIIFTSRGMSSTDGNQAASDLKYRKFTESQLQLWGVKYNRLYFGKPNADLYIDNLNMLLFDFFKD